MSKPDPEFSSKSSWWNRFAFPTFGDHYETAPSSWIELALLKDALGGGPPVLVPATHGNIATTPSEFVKAMSTALDMRILRIHSPQEEGNGTFLLGSSTAMAYCRFQSRGTWVDISMATADEGLFQKTKDFFKEKVIPDDPEAGPVYTLAKTRDGYHLHRMGAAGVPLQRENYNKTVLDAYDHIVSDLNTTNPCGRLIVLSGVPGTGKTYLVRSLLRESQQTTFVLISPQLIRDLGDPEILPSLTAAKDELPGPILLIIEDADMALVPRQADNMSTISSLLNLGDGILGSLLDIRILATTNAKKIEMDAAAMRPGRLCRQIEVDKLSQAQAQEVFMGLVEQQGRLTSSCLSVSKVRGTPFEGPATLAEIYSRARQLGWEPPTPKDDRGMKKALKAVTDRPRLR